MTGLEALIAGAGLIVASASSAVGLYLSKRARSARRAGEERIVIAGVCDHLTLRAGEGQEPGLETGDTRFDDAFVVLGPPALVHAIVDAESRRILLGLADLGVNVVVERGELHVDVPINHRVNAGDVEQRRREALSLAERLRTPARVVERLAHNAQRDPIPAVRAANLVALIREEPDVVAVRAVLRSALSDRDAEVRLAAATGLGDEADEVLYALAQDQDAGDSCASRALDAMGARFDPGRAHAILDVALGSVEWLEWIDSTPGILSQPAAAIARPSVVRSCIDALGRTGSREAVGPLRRVLMARDDTLASAAAAALVALKLSEAETALIESALVKELRAQYRTARVCAAKALGRIGTATALVPLKEAAAADAGEMRRVARAAIEDIQSRLAVAQGQVSLADGDAGRISVVDDSAGRVSLPSRERAREGK